MFKFENLHKNKKLAFLDGLLCGICVSIIARKFYKEYEEYCDLRDSSKITDERFDPAS